MSGNADFYAVNAATIFKIAHAPGRTESERQQEIAAMLRLMRCDIPIEPMLRFAEENGVLKGH
jgi:hypothetical protein